MIDHHEVKARLMKMAREVEGLTWADRFCIGQAIGLIDAGIATPPAAPAATEGVIQVKFEDNFLTEWSGSIPDGTYTLAAPAAAVPESPGATDESAP